ncbi:hypothetical protein [Cohnella sp. AR92]|uniref:hypothetical protein n=1 Tax=Cohnella sp. AR92 TaxID=648716 RepID=UPI000F8F5049|nr:hypothetical protein [Cohnella sp. AR92]RUS47792.1 hypothetical protein ELR57_08430 [Cohnella sp. AR92]
MSVRYELRCFECDILVRQNEDSYQVSIQSLSNPLGRGNPIADYGTESEAVAAADRFCQLYSLAREHDYFLQGSYFRRGEHSSFSVIQLLESRTSPEELLKLLRQEARSHDLPLPN